MKRIFANVDVMLIKLILANLLPGLAILAMVVAVGEVDCFRHLGRCVNAFVEVK